MPRPKLSIVTTTSPAYSSGRRSTEIHLSSRTSSSPFRSGTTAGKYGVWYGSDGNGGSFVYADTTGDGVADLKIQVAGVTALDLGAAQVLQADARRARRPFYDYSDRRGLPLPPNEMRGAALIDFEIPEDMRTPAALRALAAL